MLPPPAALSFPDFVERLASTEPVAHVLAVGSGPGRDALLRGLARNPRQPALTSVGTGGDAVDDPQGPFISLPNAHAVAEAWLRSQNDPGKPPLAALLDQLERDAARRSPAAQTGPVPERTKAHADFGLLLIEDAGFTGLGALDRADDGAVVLIHEPAGSASGWLLRRRLLEEPGWEPLARNTEDGSPDDGTWTAFRRRPAVSEADLPIHFFTIVLNGEPFIRYHEAVFRALPFDWHWHIVEGVASLSHDTGWSLASGGRVLDSVHDRGRSNDGTSAYLDELAARHPERITIHRKPLDRFWDGKREMVNAPLPHIHTPGLLWQVDADELWTAEQIRTVHALFQANPGRTAAYYWCDYFVGPERVISTRHNYAQNPRQEWLRTWRFEPGMTWAAHEPPTLVGADGKDRAQIDPFTQDEMEEAGVVFQHFAYATEAQAAFKESYYGYKDARAHWRRLQEEVTGSALLRDYLPWVSDETLVDTAAARGVVPIAVPEGADGAWRFRAPAEVAQRRAALSPARPKILVDGVFYQHLNSGIARVWTAVLQAWVASGFAEHVVLLDRAGTAPRIPGLHTRTIRAHSYAATGADSLYLQRVCDEEGADLFASTYYSTPTTTPSLFMGYDMIPEALGFPLDDEAWREKHRAILHAAAHVMISHNSARDLERLFPTVPPGSTAVAYCGVDAAFRPAAEAEVAGFRRRHGIDRPYILMVGDRAGYQGYKNGLLLFRALKSMAAAGETDGIMVVCVGGRPSVEEEFTALAPQVRVERLTLTDSELQLAYAGAQVLVYPSRYEGFGMPIVEAMACGCPVITCANSSILEVAGDAALFVGEDDPAGMVERLREVADPQRRAELVRRGLEQAKRFTFEAMAETMASTLTEAAKRIADGSLAKPPAAWSEVKRLLVENQELKRQAALKAAAEAAAASAVLAPVASTNVVVAPSQPPSQTEDLIRCQNDLAAAREALESIQRSPFWTLRLVVLGVLRRVGLRRRR